MSIPKTTWIASPTSRRTSKPRKLKGKALSSKKWTILFKNSDSRWPKSKHCMSRRTPNLYNMKRVSRRLLPVQAPKHTMATNVALRNWRLSFETRKKSVTFWTRLGKKNITTRIRYTILISSSIWRSTKSRKLRIPRLNLRRNWPLSRNSWGKITRGSPPNFK